MKKKNNKEYGHIAVSLDSKNKFNYLKKELMTLEKPKVTDDELLNYLMNLLKK